MLEVSFDYDSDMPKVDKAHSIKEFFLGNKFQKEFDKWKAEVETEQKGRLEIVHEEVVQNDAKIIIFWRVVPRPATARSR